LPEVISDTSPLQYLHQLGLLHHLPTLVGPVVVPSAVKRELLIGRSLGIDLPDLDSLQWVEVRSPTSRPALPLINDLGPGETETLMLALELPGSSVLLDDGLARRVAESLEIEFTGTLGLLLGAKRKGLISSLLPLLDQLQTLRFRLSSQTRVTILKLAGENG